MPYFYLCRQLATHEEKCASFNLLLELYLRSLKKFPEYIKYFLYITHFCISDNYECLDDRSLEMFLEVLSLAPEVARECMTNLSLENLLGKKLNLPEKLKVICKMPAKSFYQLVEADWKQIWSSLQSFSRFWAHPSFNFQRNKPFHPKDYVYNPSLNTFYQWSISNFVTKEWARPLIEPVFREPLSKADKFLIELETRNSHVLLSELDCHSQEP